MVRGLTQANVRLPAVGRTVDVIQLLSRSDKGLTLSEIYRTIGIPKSSAHYLIQTLLARGFLYRNANGHTYAIGPEVPEFFAASGAVHDLRDALREDLRQLARITGLTALANVLKGAQAVTIEKMVPPQRESAGDRGNWIGRRIDLHCTAQGKVLLAYLPDVELEHLYRDRPLVRFTAKTISSLADLRAHLAKVRSDGFALNDEEHIAGVRGIAAPVFNSARRVIVAIGLTGSVQEMPREGLPRFARQVTSVAKEASRELLGSSPQTSERCQRDSQEDSRRRPLHPLLFHRVSQKH